MTKKDVYRGCPGMAIDRLRSDSSFQGEHQSSSEILSDFRVDQHCMINLWLDLFCILDAEGKFRNLSQAWESILGYTEDALIGTSFRDITHPDDLPQSVEQFVRLTQGEKVVNFINRFRHADGHYIWLEWRAAPDATKDMFFAVAREVSRFMDIEEDVRLKTVALTERLKELNCLYKVTNFLQDISVSIEGIIPQLVPLIVEAYQYPEITEVMITFNGHEYKSTGYRETEWSQVSNITADGKPAGTIRVCYVRPMPVIDEGPFMMEERSLLDSLAKMIGQFAERAESYRQSTLISKIMESSMDAIGTFSFDGTILSWSQGATRLYGLTADEMVGKNVEMLYPPERKKDLVYFVSELKKGRRIDGFETQRIKPDGTLLDIFIVMTPLMNDKGVYDRYLSIIHDITERKKKERELKKSEELFRLLAENVNDVIWTLDLNGKFLYVSPSVERLRGFTVEEVMQQSIDEALTPESARLAMESMNAAMPDILAGKPMPPVTTILEQTCKDGSTVWTEATISNIFDEKGKFLFFLGVTRDITDRKVAEEKLNLMEAAIKSTISPTAIADRNGTVVFANQAFVKLWGFNEQTEVVGKHFVDFSGNKDQARSAIQMVLKGENKSTETIGKRKDGSLFDLFISINPVYSKDKKLTHVMASFIDISERKKAELSEKLINERVAAQYRISLLEDKKDEEIVGLALDEAVKLTKSGSGFFHFLDHMEENLTMTGWTSEVTRTCRMPDSVHYPVSEAGIWAEAIRSKVHYICNDYEAAVGKKGVPDGHSALTRFISLPLVENGKVQLILGVCNKDENYTELEASQLSIFMDEVWKVIKKSRLKEELKTARQKAEESSTLKSSLLLNMSHELRTPLNGILGFAGLLKEVLKDEEAQNMVNYINISGKRLMVTLTSILELSQLETEKKILHPTLVKLSELTHNTCSRFTDQLSMKNLHFSKMVEDDLVLYTDQNLVSNIFYYIIDNAIKFTESGQVWVSLQKTLRNGEEKILFQVKDTGIGISEEQMKYIFEPFRQGSEGIGRSHEGNGLGLTLCKRFLDLLNGDIEIDSRPDLGSTFSVYFKLHDTDSSADTRSHRFIETTAASPNRKSQYKGKPTILIVEDNETNIEFISVLLEERFIVERAMTGKMAIKLCNINAYALILMDINLGSEMDGIEATKAIRNLPKNSQTPVIAVTGYATDKEKNAILSHGLNDYLAKPFTREELNSVINRVMNSD